MHSDTLTIFQHPFPPAIPPHFDLTLQLLYLVSDLFRACPSPIYLPFSAPLSPSHPFRPTFGVPPIEGLKGSALRGKYFYVPYSVSAFFSAFSPNFPPLYSCVLLWDSTSLHLKSCSNPAPKFCPSVPNILLKFLPSYSDEKVAD